ncbi:unnamed protein product [Arabis nemorensis]|uniref:FAD-binding FR-type domain-containing protein n=1 Tax=Arabis nemorensis TaxID=586526 RepID=A0A565BH85_9BRAS|nr:unnamed protein product [Arabis nemorensis]
MENVSDVASDRSIVKENPTQKRIGLVKRLAFVSNQLKRLASVSRESEPLRTDQSKSTTGQALKGLKFISMADGGAGWTAVEKRFVKITSTSDGSLPRSKFGDCIGMNSKDFALELFDTLARRRNMTGDSIDKKQFKEFLGTNKRSKLRFKAYDVFRHFKGFLKCRMDKDANGRLTEDEVREIESLKSLPLQAETQSVVTNNEERKKLNDMLNEKLKPTRDPNILKRWYCGLRFFVLDSWQRIWVIALWLTVMAILFRHKYIQYKNREVYEVLGHCVCLAKGAAETLKLNMAVILLPVCRNTITWLRNKTKFGVVVPFDDNLNFHKVIAVGIAIGVGIHSLTHLACDFPRLIAASPEAYMPLGKFFGEEQPKRYLHFVKSTEGITGLVMCLLMVIAFTLATPWFRRGKLQKQLPVPLKKLASFNAFWYSHHLFVLVYIHLVIHGYNLYLSKKWYKKTTWMYLAVPVALYACERLIRAFRSNIWTVTVVKAVSYPGNVLTLHMSRPSNFEYESGQYMFIKCPAISQFEWHPFSITYIKSLGDWTTAIKEVFSEVCKASQAGDMLHGANNPE